MKIQDGSSNIMLDNAQGDARQVTYTRRSRLIEDLLDEEKDISGNLPINFTSSTSSVVLSTASNQSNTHHGELFSTNKTDSEKFNEIQCKEVSVTNNNSIVLPEEQSSSVVKESEAIAFKNSDSLSSENEVHDNIILRRQQLTRVAEWVQNSSNIPLPNTPEQKLPDNGTLSESSALNMQIKTAISMDLENNNSLASQSLANQAYNEANPLCERNAQSGLAEKLNGDDCGSSIFLSSSKLDCLDMDDSNDLAQMEYNVKKFLLKQNEWSISRPLSVSSYCKSTHESSEESIFIRKPYQRTETNL